MVSCQLSVLFISTALAMANAGAGSLAGRQEDSGCDCQSQGNEQLWGTIAPSTRILELCEKNTEQYWACGDENNMIYCVKWDNPASCECIAQEAKSWQTQTSEGWQMADIFCMTGNATAEPVESSNRARGWRLW